MGTRKSSAGRLIARRLDKHFVDMDDLIESRVGKSISRIFAEEGEPYFRDVERSVVQDLSGCDNQVVATGGGVVLNPDNLRDFARNGVLICLQADPSTILKRVAAQTHRPLLENGEKAARIMHLLESRRTYYEAVPHQINTSTLSLEEVVEKIMELYSTHRNDMR
jgi:shikimate kinase